MVITDYRSGADIDFARHLGEHLGEQLIRRAAFSNLFARRMHASKLLKDVLGNVVSYVGQKEPQLAPLSVNGLTKAYRGDVENVLRLLWLERNVDLGGVPVLAEDADAVLGATPVDIFNPFALHRLLAQSESPDALNGVVPVRAGSSKWRQSLKQLLERSSAVNRIDQGTAARGFVSLLADAMRGLYKGYSQRGQIDTLFTVHSGHGYQIRVYETLRYSPVVFGSRTSSPVKGRLRFGHYKFEGVKRGALVPDSGTYPVSPHDTTATLVDF